MAPPAPAAAGRVVSLHVSASGTVLSDLPILSVEIVREVDRIPRAKLVIRDGEPATGAFPASARSELAPGSVLKISAGYGKASPVRLFEGLVVRHGIEIQPGASRLVIELADKAVRLTAGRMNRVATGKSVSQALTASLKAAGLPGPDLSKLSAAQEAVVQADASDWDFLLAAARAAGAAVVVTDGVVKVAAPNPAAKPSVQAVYGGNIVRMDVSADASRQYASSGGPARAWSYADQAMSEAAASEGASESLPPTAFTVATLEAVMGSSARPLATSATLTVPTLQAAADAAYLRARLTRIQGSVEFAGDGDVKPDSTIQLKGVGPSLSGPAWVRGVRHRISASRWTTTAFLGLEAPPAAAASTSSLGGPPPIRGLHIGKVRKIVEDPSTQHRIFVNLPAIKDKANEEGVWARLAQPYASNGVGMIAFPEVDDEVLVAFVNEDPRTAVVLAGLYSSTRPPAYPADKENIKKALVTRSKMEITFDDKDVILEMRTPEGHNFTLNNKTKAIELKDKTGSTLTMDEKGMRLNSPKDIEITADGKITITAKGDLETEGGPTATLKGKAVTITGTDSLTAESKGVGALKATGELTVSGSLVKIN